MNKELCIKVGIWNKSPHMFGWNEEKIDTDL